MEEKKPLEDTETTMRYRINHLEVCYYKVALKMFCKIHRRTQAMTSFLVKLQVKFCNFTRIEHHRKCFPENFYQFSQSRDIQTT